MALRLRTRLFLIVAAVLGASILLSAVLSRRATLVEVRATAGELPDPAGTRMALDRALEVVAETPVADLPQALAAIEKETSRRLLVVDGSRAVVAASNRSLAGATIKTLSNDGTFSARLGTAGAESQIELRGAPMETARLANGEPATIVLLPALEESDLVRVTRIPLWLLTTVGTAALAVPIVFAVSRRILEPIASLREAARRIQAGDLDARVAAGGGDELSELAAAFNGMAQRLAETERLRKQMVSDVAHELRSPVTNLRCTLEAIQDGLMPPDRASLAALHDDTLLLQRLISDLEDLALGDAGALSLRVEEVDLRQVISAAVRSVPASAEHAPVRVDVPDDLPGVRGDSGRLEQVFRNLLSNARLHTPAHGRIEVIASRDGRFVHVEVVDTGAGIDPAHLPHVFERFYRADRSRARATGGAGLGLAIARQLVTAQGGTIRAESDGPGRGTRMTVSLQIA